MRAGAKLAAVALFCASVWTAACGQEPATASLATALQIPRALADDLDTVIVYLFQTEKLTYEPKCEQLDADFAAYQGRAFKQTPPIDLQQSQNAVLDGIPDRGGVWRFYARGFDASDNPIARGCFPAAAGGKRILPGEDTSVIIDMTAGP